MRVRSELPADGAAIEGLIVEAFKGSAHTNHTEQFIVRELRNAGALSVSLVAEESGVIIGHVAVSPVTISDGAVGWYGLGPISVAPARQGELVGTQLMQGALNVLRSNGASGCVVLGEPAYYSRFGFIAAPSLVLPAVAPQYFLALSFKTSLPIGTVSYHEAFASKI